MDAILVKVFSEQGIIYGIFVATFLSFIWRGIPYAVRKFDEVVGIFKQSQKDQQEVFVQSLDKIITSFREEGKSNSDWHREHALKLDEIKQQLEENNKQLEKCKFVQSVKIKAAKE